MPFGNTHNKFKLNYKPQEEYPDLSKHNNHMAKVLTPELYAELHAKCTLSSVPSAHRAALLWTMPFRLALTI